jgi:hypothetical protein
MGVVQRAAQKPTFAQQTTAQQSREDLAVRHLLSHIDEQPAVAFVATTHQPAQAAQQTRIFTLAAPGNLVSGFTLRKIGQLGRFFAIVEQLVERNLHRSRQFFERLDGRHGVAIFHARNVTAEKSGALLDVTLGKFFCFSKQADTISNYHGRYCCMKYFIVARRKLAFAHNLTGSQQKNFDVT